MVFKKFSVLACFLKKKRESEQWKQYNTLFSAHITSQQLSLSANDMDSIEESCGVHGKHTTLTGIRHCSGAMNKFTDLVYLNLHD